MGLGIICWFVYKYAPTHYRNISIVGLYTFILLGISDFVEIKTQGFLFPIIWWLLIWKIACLISIILLGISYVRVSYKN